MKILLISNMYPSKEDPVYGNFVKEQVDELRSKGYEIDTCVINKRGGNTLQKLWKYTKLWSGYLTRGLFKKYDMVHVHYLYPTSMVLPLIQLLTKKKVVITVHETDPLFFTGMKRKLVSYVLKNSVKVIAVSDNLKADLETEFELDPKNVLSINCGVNREKFPALNDRKGFKEKLGLDPEKKLILFLGRTYEEKGVYTFVDVVKRLKEDPTYQFAVVGNGPETENVLKKLTDMGADFTYQPGIPKDEVYQWFNAAELFVFPTEKEAFGLVALESASCGTPVIASNVGGVPETIRHGKSGFLVPIGDSVQIAEHIETLLYDQTLYETLQRGCEEVANEFAIDHQLLKVEQCYKDVLNPTQYAVEKN